MRAGVLILTPYFFPVMGGVESNAGRLARYLAAGHVRVRVLTKRIGPELPDEETRDGVAIARIGPRGERSTFGKWRLVPAAFVWLVRHASEYDVVCCVDYRATGIAALMARFFTARPFVIQAQTTGVLSGDNADAALAAVGIAGTSGIGRALKRRIAGVYGQADAVSGISHEIEREALAAGIPAERVYYFPNAIDMDEFRPATPAERIRLRHDHGLPVDRLICLFAGRLSREKGLLDLLEAWRLLSRTWGPPSGGPSSGAGPLLVIAGPDMTGHRWDVGVSGRAFVASHALAQSVRFLGPIGDVARLVRACDLFVQPSHFEALGLSAIEALASGVPVVASAVGGLVEFIVDGRNGRLCPPQNPQALAAAIGALLSDRNTRERLASGARESVLQEYDERIVFGRMRDLFERLASGRDRPHEH